MKSFILSIILTANAAITVFAAQVSLQKLTVEGREHVEGLDDPQPRFGWQIKADVNDVRQQSYRMLVASSQALCTVGKSDIWDSHVINSDQSQWVEYKGKSLAPNTQYFWKVISVTNKGQAESVIASWSTGMSPSINRDGWEGSSWIGYDSITPDVKMERHSRIASRYLHKDFTLSSKKKVIRATAHICGLGYYILSINGQRVGNYLLCPAPTQFDTSVTYDTYGVTDLFQVSSSKSSKSIDIALGGGYFFPMTQKYQTNVRSAYGMPKARMELIIEYEDGTEQVIPTDATWKVAVDGPIRYANIYDGTLINYNLQPTNYMPVQIVQAPCGIMRGGVIGGVINVGEDKASEVIPVSERSSIIDFGTNNAGRIFLAKVTIPKGDTIRIRYAETLQKDGKALYTANLRQSQNTDYFIGNGKPVDLTTEFIWHGFRFAEVSGILRKDAARITRQNMSDDIISSSSIHFEEAGATSLSSSTSTSSLSSSSSSTSTSSMLSRILDNARRGIISNYKGIPMDCPQRDERMPWTGDRTMGCFGESYVTENHTLYAKWLQDMCDGQRKDGAISDVTPTYWRLFTNNITWPAALPMGMEMLRLQYGDMRPVQQHYDNVKHWLSSLKGRKSWQKGLLTNDKYGDWCVPPASLDEVLTKDPKRITKGAIISSSYYYYICNMMADWATQLGKKEDVSFYHNEANAVKDSINSQLLHNGNYANGTVTANLLPLAFNIVPDSAKAEVTNHFKAKLKSNIDCGVIGISWLMRYLSKSGLGNVAYQIASTKTYPGWGYMVENGATTIWELWNGNTANPSMNSGNHVMMLGDLIPWCYEYLAGIAPDPQQPGFKHILMHPDFSIKEMNGVDCTYPSVYGDVKSTWIRTAGKVTWTVTIPANTTATLTLPDGTKQEYPSGTYIITQ